MKFRILSHIYTAIQAFVLCVIVMEFIFNYNRSQLPIALICLIISVFARVLNKK